MARALSDADAVRARIASVWLECAGARGAVGRFDLREAQRETTAAVLRAIKRHGGALVADPPGTGKTIIALAVAAQLNESPLVVAPSALRAQWLRASTDAGVTIRFVSFEMLGRSAPAGWGTLVIVDEAHHARTPATRRYARLADICATARVLLLSATPVVNRASDRDALLALFLGARATSLSARELSEIVIRRGDDSTRPAVRRLSTLSGASDVAGLGDALARLPAPFPTADGRAATELVRISLAMAWRSSLAALDAALRRREQRGTVLRDALAEGRWPDRSALRLWLVGDDATQLALPIDLGRVERQPSAGAASSVDAHLTAVRGLRALIHNVIAQDTSARAAALLALCTVHPTKRVVCFAQCGATVRALWSWLRTSPGVVAITGERVYAAAGRWTREEVLRSLGTHAGALRAGDPRAIRLLLSTDLLAEGVELQGVGIVVHGDAAWTPARLEQRVGRAVRVGSIEREILVTGFRAPTGAGPLLALAARLARKRTARVTALEAAERESRVAQLLGRWRADAVSDVVSASALGPRRCFIAVLERDTLAHRSLLCGTWDRGHWVVTDDPRVVARLIAASGGATQPVDPQREATARDAIHRWERSRRAHATMGNGANSGDALWRRLRMRIDRALQRSSPAYRTNLALEWSSALETLAAMPGIGTRRRVAAADRATSADGSFVDSLLSLVAESRAAGPSRDHPAERRSNEPPRILALLLVGPRPLRIR